MSGYADERDPIIADAIRRHDMQFGRDHCDRKYILSCSELPNLILERGRPEKVETS